MSQFVVPHGFELVGFAWEDMSAFAVASACVAVLQTPVVCRAQTAAVAASAEPMRFEEDMERWDGLS